MKFSEIKALKKFCETLDSEPNWREVLERILLDDDDFTVNDVRFIDADSIDDILVDELMSDNYLLGCFTPEAIEYATDWPIVLIEAAQKGEAFEAIGEAMTKEHVEKLAEYYSGADGYGHHFNSYNGSEERYRIGNKDFYVFDNH